MIAAPASRVAQAVQALCFHPFAESSHVMTNDLNQHKHDWEQSTLNKVLSRFPERKTAFTTSSDIPVERIYTPETCDAELKSRQCFQIENESSAEPVSEVIGPTYLCLGVQYTSTLCSN
jgi:hypothetical protein